MSINIGEWVLSLAVLGQHTRGNLIHEGNKVHKGIILDVLLRELSLACETRVRLSQHSVSVSGDYTTAVQNFPALLLDSLRCHLLIAKVSLELLDEAENLLVGQTVERSSKAVHGSGKRKVRVRKSTADQVGSVGRHIATLVVRVDDQVETHELNELGITESKHVSEVLTHVSIVLHRSDLAVLEDVAVDEGCDTREAGNASKHVLESRAPVLSLLHSLLVRCCELGIPLACKDTHGELSHWVKILGEVENSLLNPIREGSPFVHVSLEAVNLGLGRDLAREKKPDK
mmetsp:Transcript_16508/g.25635  ORF Transcript_16508/g.25635 Transcript_16508/m.25635 type:complete len:287 (+) Transcript_16508:2780-3640(+)